MCIRDRLSSLPRRRSATRGLPKTELLLSEVLRCAGVIGAHSQRNFSRTSLRSFLKGESQSCCRAGHDYDQKTSSWRDPASKAHHLQNAYQKDLKLRIRPSPRKGGKTS